MARLLPLCIRLPCSTADMLRLRKNYVLTTFTIISHYYNYFKWYYTQRYVIFEGQSCILQQKGG